MTTTALRLCPRDPQGNEEDDADDDKEDDAIATNDDSFHAESQEGSNVSADAEGQVFLPDAVVRQVISYVRQLPSERPGQQHH